MKKEKKSKKTEGVQEAIASQPNPLVTFELTAKATKQPRKVKTTKELIEDMQKLEKRILNEVVKNPARALEIGRMYMAGYNTFNSKQKEAYRRVASAVQAR